MKNRESLAAVEREREREHTFTQHRIYQFDHM